MNNFKPRMEWDLNTLTWVNEKRLPGFGRLLESWLNVHRNYCAGVFPELPWEYAERPQIGLLSNAAATIGGIALEEWCTEKVSDQQANCYGRNDLWLRLSPASNKQDYQIEAKYGRLDLRLSARECIQRIASVTNEARLCAEKLRPEGGKPVAISFLALRFQDENTASLDSKMNELLFHIQEQNRQINNMDAISAVWFGVEDFQQCRNERKQIAAKWTNNEVGMMLLASRIQ